MKKLLPLIWLLFICQVAPLLAVTQITDSLYVKQGAKITRLYTDSAALRTMTLSGSPIGTPGDSCMFLNLGVPVHCTKAQVLAWLGSSGITSINTGTAAAHTIVGEQGLQVLDSGTNLYKHVIVPATGYIIPTGSNMRVDSTTLADSAADAGKWGGNVYGGPYLGIHATADTAIAADRARKLATTRTIGKSTTFDGTANIVPDSAVSVVQATQLTTARTIGNTSFNGTANIIPDTANKANRARYSDSTGKIPDTVHIRLGLSANNINVSNVQTTNLNGTAIGSAYSVVGADQSGAGTAAANAAVSGTSGDFAKFTGAHTVGNSSFMSENGTGVGIGTTSPGNQLAVINSTSTFPNPLVAFELTNAGATNGLLYLSHAGPGYILDLVRGNSSDPSSGDWIHWNDATYGPSSGGIKAGGVWAWDTQLYGDQGLSLSGNGYSAASPSMVITTGSKVGIGTTSPDSQLTVSAGAHIGGGLLVGGTANVSNVQTTNLNGTAIGSAYSVVGADQSGAAAARQAAYANLTSIGSLANASGWLNNNGSGGFAYSTPPGTWASNFGTTVGTICQGNDSRLSDSRAPNGSASGDLSGSYPGPTVAKIKNNTVPVNANGSLINDGSGNLSWTWPTYTNVGADQSGAGTAAANAAVSGTSGDFAKFTGAHTVGNSSFMSENGTGVGIGTTSPGNQLAVINSTSTFPNPLVAFELTNAGATNGLLYLYHAGTGHILDLVRGNSSDPSSGDWIHWNSPTYGPSSGGIKAGGSWAWDTQLYGDQGLSLSGNGYSAASPSMVITTGGNVGIGTATPSQKLEVNGNILLESGWNLNLGTGSTAGMNLNGNQINLMTSCSNSEVAFNYTGKSNAAFSIYNGAGGSPKISLNPNGNSYLIGGNVGIGTTSPGYPLDVWGYINASNSGGTANVYMGIGGEGAVIFENNAGGISINSNDGAVSLNANTGASLTVNNSNIVMNAGGIGQSGVNIQGNLSVSGNDTVGGKLTAGSFGGGDGTGLLSVGTLTSSVVSSAQVTTTMLTPAINTYSLTSNHTFDMSVQNAVIIITGTTGSWTVSFTNAVQGQVIWVINSTTTNFYIATSDGSHTVLGNTAEMVICDGSGKYFKIQ